MIRRNRVCSVLVLVLALTFTHDAFADGLYVGHGRRSVDDAWSVRLNLSGGAAGFGDPWENDSFSDTEFPIGGYGTAGLEFNVGNRNSLELWTSVRGLNDEEGFLEVDDFGDVVGRGLYDYEVRSWSGGLTLRHRYPNPGGSAYWGVGGGLVEAQVDYLENVQGSTLVDVDESDVGPTAHFLIGFDGRLSPGLTLGLELGYRHAWLEYDNDIVSGDDSGVFAGLKLGLVLGRP